jgi:rhamnosyltransferase
MSVVTVAVPVLDGGPRLAAVLAGVRAQELDREVELLVCDSGSTDDSPAVARRCGARVLEIARQDFSHGATRNLLMEEAAGEHVAFLTQDAEPAGRSWLATLLGGFEEADDIGLTFGPYQARPEASAMTRRELAQWFASFAPDGRPRIDRLPPAERGVPALALLGPRGFFTDANGCVSRSAWREVPFRSVPYAEDHQLAIDMLRAGYAKVYLPGAAVLHSHDYSAAELLRRSFDEWRALREIYGFVEPLRAGTLRAKVLSPARADLRWTRSQGEGWAQAAALLPRALAHHAARTAGALAGSRADRLPTGVRRRLSLERRDSFGG